jgi:hypothetical protein
MFLSSDEGRETPTLDRSSFQNVVFVLFQIPDDGQSPQSSDSYCYVPLSEPLRFYITCCFAFCVLENAIFTTNVVSMWTMYGLLQSYFTFITRVKFHIPNIHNMGPQCIDAFETQSSSK